MPEVLIVVHGLHRNVPQWFDIMWGRPGDNMYGRASRALRMSESFGDPVLFLGGGGVVDGSGVSDAEATKALILEKASELYDCSFEKGSCPEKVLRARLLADMTASNTQQEITSAFEACRQRSIPNMILVSSPTHIARCLQRALVTKEELGCNICIQAVPSDVNYAGTFAKDVVIIEPPHLPETSHEPFHRLAQQMIPLVTNGNKASVFAHELGQLIRKHNT